MPISVRQKTGGLFGLAIFLMALVIFTDFLHFRKYQKTIDDVLHTESLLQELDQVQDDVQSAETGQRGYLLSGDEDYLRPFNVGTSNMALHMDQLKKLTVNNKDYQTALPFLQTEIGEKINELSETIRLAKQGHRDAAMAMIRSNKGFQHMEKIRAEIARLEALEKERLLIRYEKLHKETDRRLIFIVLGIFVTLVALFWMNHLLREEINQRRLSEEQLRDTQKQLQQHAAELTASNNELEAFCYSVSHDLRAPLRGIEGFSRIVLEKYKDLIDAEGQGYLDRVRNGVKRMGQLIDDLLRLSRITRAEIRSQPFDLSEVARAVADELQQSQPERKVRWIIPATLPVKGDVVLLRTVLENLMGNAWKFTSKKNEATIELGHPLDPTENVFFVKDDGAGFDMAYSDKLFAAFQRLHSPGEFHGTGIGLATVQRVIHRHSGRVWAEGYVDRGATFYFTLAS